MADSKNYRFETLQLHVGQEQADPATDSRAVPIYQTTSYVFHNFDHAEARFGLADPGNIYGRLTNSTQSVFEDRIAALEGGTAGLAVASGAAAVEYAVRNITQSGDHIVAAKNIYGGPQVRKIFDDYRLSLLLSSSLCSELSVTCHLDRANYNSLACSQLETLE